MSSTQRTHAVQPQLGLDQGNRIEGSLGHDYTELAKHLSGLTGRVVLVPNPGNAGDCIICTGSYHVFRHVGLNPEIGDWRETYPDAHVIYDGGGNMIPHYRQAWTSLKSHIDNCRSFTLMPHTTRGGEDVLSRLDERFTLFARERKTFQHLSEYATGATVRLSHDMAFANDIRNLDRLEKDMPVFRNAPFGSGSWRRQARSQMYWMARQSRNRWRGEKFPSNTSLNAFRMDQERSGAVPLPKDNIDVSDHLAFPQDSSPFIGLKIARKFVSHLDRYETIRTDRLHVAITGILLGKKVEAWDNSYGKLFDVLSHSLPKQVDDVLVDKVNK